ncbi:MAG: NAD(P)H-dependent oxidoreductase [Methylacidiphilales bacterium]|nr:NAD(P)H-dependent oxidoreductase [Candidatus Methylacidiphilales bacterium]
MATPSSPEYLIISASLRSASLSRIMAETLAAAYAKLGATHQLIDLREYVLPLCDGEAAYEHPHVTTLSALIEAARVIVVATPIYNYDANATAKNLVELTGSSWENKTVGFLCAAGGASSYMSIMGLANSLMLDFRCLIIPRFVYAKGEDFNSKKTPTAEMAKRIHDLAEASIKIRNA